MFLHLHIRLMSKSNKLKIIFFMFSICCGFDTFVLKPKKKQKKKIKKKRKINIF